jgi:hypothetical protein
MSESVELIAPKVKSVKGKIAIRPYVPIDEVRVEKMGLDEEGEALFPGTYQIDYIGLEEKNGIKTYFTGLNEFAPSVQMLVGDKKNAKVRAIRETVAFLENTIANNFTVSRATCMDGYGTGDDKFWQNVKMFNSSGPDKFDAKGNRIPTYWDGVKLQVDNKGRELDLTNGHDLVIYHAIMDSGLSMIATSLSVAMTIPGYNFYLDQPEETHAIKSEHKKLKTKALGKLQELIDTDKNKLFLLAKMVSITNSTQYRRGGPSYTTDDQLFDDIYNYMDGKLGDDTKIAVPRFLEFCDIPIDELKRRAVTKDAIEMHLIEPKGDGNLWYIRRNTKLGRNIEDIVEYLSNKLNSDIWEDIYELVEKEWAS